MRGEVRRICIEQDKTAESEIYLRAIEFIPKRYPKGWGVVAIIHTKRISIRKIRALSLISMLRPVVKSIHIFSL